MQKLLAVVIPVILMAGCATKPAETAESPSMTSLESRPETATSTTTVNIPYQRPALAMNGCRGMSDFQVLLSEDSNAFPPEGWAPSQSELLDVSLKVYNCNRFALQAYERPNVTFALQTHNNGIVPAGCAEHEGNQLYSEIIHVILISDRDLATALSGFGINAIFAKFTLEEVRVGDVLRQRWIIEPDGFAASWVERAHSQPPSVRLTETIRFFWQNPWKGVSYAEFESSIRYPNEPVPPVIGVSSAPLVTTSSGMHVGIGSLVFEDSWVNAPVYEFGDAECAFPLS